MSTKDAENAIALALSNGTLGAYGKGTWWVQGSVEQINEIAWALPVDLTDYTDFPCVATFQVDYPPHVRIWHCTRSEDHTGRHAAGDGSRVYAVW